MKVRTREPFKRAFDPDRSIEKEIDSVHKAKKDFLFKDKSLL